MARLIRTVSSDFRNPGDFKRWALRKGAAFCYEEACSIFLREECWYRLEEWIENTRLKLAMLDHPDNDDSYNEYDPAVHGSKTLIWNEVYRTVTSEELFDPFDGDNWNDEFSDWVNERIKQQKEEIHKSRHGSGRV